MVCFYVIYRYVFSKWRPIRPVVINQYDITIATHYNSTMGNDVTRDAQCEIIMCNDFSRDIHCDVTMHNDVAMNVLYYVFSTLCLILLFYSGYYGITTKTNSCLISLGGKTHLLFLCRAISRPSDSWNIPTQTQFMCSPQTDQTLTCSCYTLYNNPRAITVSITRCLSLRDHTILVIS